MTAPTRTSPRRVKCAAIAARARESGPPLQATRSRGRSAAFGAVQPVAGSAYGDGLKAYLASPGLVACGDYVAAGDVRSDLPCEGSRRVASVEDMTLLGAYHHPEVVAR